MNANSTVFWTESRITLLGIFIAAILTIAGWIYASHTLAEQELRNLRYSYMSNAFRDISFYSTLMRFNNAQKDDFIKFERAFKDIQLYGLDNEIQLAQDVIRKLTAHQTTDFDPLLNLLRDNLRKEFGLEKVNFPTLWVMDTAVYNRNVQK
jgi:hypothetical protein